MPEQKVVKIKALCKYNGHSIKANSSVDLDLLFTYEELPNYIKLIQLLNENISISVKIGDEDITPLGTFMLRSTNIDHDGQGKIKFNSQVDHVEADNLNTLVGQTFKILFRADVELEKEEED